MNDKSEDRSSFYKISNRLLLFATMYIAVQSSHLGFFGYSYGFFRILWGSLEFFWILLDTLHTLGEIASICFKSQLCSLILLNTTEYRQRSRILRGVQKYPLPGRPSTQHWVKSKTIIEKLRKLRMKFINQLIVNVLPQNDNF